MQNYFLTSPQELKINKILYEIKEVGFYYDCNDSIIDIEDCKNNEKCRAFHFLQKNHFAFDSILYDGKTQALALIQITINENHTQNYEDIDRYMKKPTTADIKPENKYHKFFLNLTQKKLVKTYIFQWNTNKKYPEIKKKADEFWANHKSFTIEYYSEDFFELLERKKLQYIH